MAATTYPAQIVSRCQGGDHGQILYHCLEANSQSFKAGDLVYLNSGAVTVVASDGVIVMGIALKNATNVTSGNIEIPVEVIKTGDTVRLHGTATGTATLSSSFTIGNSYSLYCTAGTGSQADYDDTSHDCFVIKRQVKKADGNYDYWVDVVFEVGCLQDNIGDAAGP